MAASEVEVRASLDDNLSAPLDNVRRKVRDLGDETTKAGSKARASSGSWGVLSKVAGGIGKTLAVAGTVGITALGAGLAAAGTVGVKTASQMEQARISFETMLGSADKAGAFLKDLQAFAAKTPFEFPELQTAAASLVSVGVDADKVIPIMRTLGDVTSGMGTGSEGVQRATVALQQMAAAGRITGEDLNQLRDAGIPVFDLLAAATGKSKEQVAQLAQSGKLGKREMEAMFKALETGKGLEKFNGLMQKQSQSLEGRFSTLKDNVGQSLATMVTPVLPVLGAALDGVAARVSSIDWSGIGQGLADAIATGQATIARLRADLDALAAWVQANSAWLAPLAAAITAVAAVWAVWTGAVAAWQGVMTVATAIQAGFNLVMAANPVMLVVMAIAALVAGLVVFFTQTETGRAAWAAFTGFIVSAWNTATAALSAGFTAVVGWFAALPGRISGGMAAFGAMVGTGIARAVAWFTGLPGRVGGALSAFAARVAVGAALAALYLWSRIKGGIDRAVAFVQGLPGRVAGALGGLAGALGGAAAAAVNALVAPFTGVAGRVASALKGAYDTAVRWANKIGDAARGAWNAATGGGGGAAGDTATSRAMSGSSWVGALPYMGPGQSISNIAMGGGGMGRGSGDHQRGAAVDVVGPGLLRLTKAVTAAGGYGAIHGTGGDRHAHLVPSGPMGDTSSTRVGFRPSGTSTAPAPVLAPSVTVNVNVTGSAAEDPHEVARRCAAEVNLAIRHAVERS